MDASQDEKRELLIVTEQDEADGVTIAVQDEKRELLIVTEQDEADGVTIQDTGPGLPAATLIHLFDAFCTTKVSGMVG